MHWVKSGQQDNHSQVAIMAALESEYKQSDIVQSVRRGVFHENTNPWDGMIATDKACKQIKSMLESVICAEKSGKLPDMLSTTELNSKSVEHGACGHVPLTPMKKANDNMTS